MTVELVLFITNEKTEEDTYTHYKFARLADVHQKHVDMAGMRITNTNEYVQDAEVFGFFYAVEEHVDEDIDPLSEDIERGRLDAQRLFIATTKKPDEFLNNSGYVVSKIYVHTYDSC
jgi:hypothetical protein